MKRVAGLTAVVALLVLAAWARDFVMPKLVPADTMACKDAHVQEKVTVGADAYDTAAKAAIFHPAMLEHAVLPVLVVFTNNSDSTVVLNQARFQLVTRDRAKATPYSMDDLYRVFTALRAPGSRGQDKLPIPLPGKNKAHSGFSKKDKDELEQAMFAARAVERHSSQQGFLFFDVGDLDDPTNGARLYVTGVKDSTGQELMYFEVPLGQP